MGPPVASRLSNLFQNPTQHFLLACLTRHHPPVAHVAVAALLQIHGENLANGAAAARVPGDGTENVSLSGISIIGTHSISI